jgi:hypothetical protein
MIAFIVEAFFSGMDAKRRLGKKNASLAVGWYAVLAAMVCIIGKPEGPKACASTGRTNESNLSANCHGAHFCTRDGRLAG